jgi:YfiH family protein
VTAASNESAAPPSLQLDVWRQISGLRHGFFGRHGGVSAGPWATLNVSLSVGDDARSVATNWSRLGSVMPGLSVVRMRQVHGVSVVRTIAADQPTAEADGLFANHPGLALAVLTADCVPILCVAPDARAVMVLHAGWRGTLGGIAAAGVAAAQESIGVDPGAWQVALGPSIAGCCYEVEADIGDQVINRWGTMPDAWQPAGSHGQLDLRAANRHILRAQGVPETQIFTVGPCTSCQSENYFSHRRSGGRAGRQVSVIGWAA